MTTVPSDRTRAFWAAQTTFTLSGVTYASIANIDLKWGYKIHEEVVTGTSLPYLGTGVFHGEVSVEALGSDDSRWENAIGITSGIAATFGMTWRELNTSNLGTSGARTWTVSGKFEQYTKKTQKDQSVFYTLKAILATEPTVVNS